MRLQLIFISLVTFYAQCITAQTPITAVTITNTVSTTNTYTITTASQNYEGLSGQLGTYKWGVSPNNITVLMNNFTANGVTYAPNNQGQGSIIIRRVNNTNINYNRTVMWAESVRSGTNDHMHLTFRLRMLIPWKAL